MQALLVAVILIAAAFLLIDWQRRGPSGIQKIFLLALMAVSLAVYTDFGRLMFVSKRFDPDYQAAKHTTEKRTFLHWHEIYHYYLGAKYFREIGYNGLYETILLADREQADEFANVTAGLPFITVARIRDLSNIMHSISAEEALERARTLYRPRFTDARWQAFKADWLTMKKLCDTQWLNLAMYDAGFNPPPSWAVIGTTFAQHIPISTEWFASPRWDQIELLPFLDVTLMLLASLFLYRSFGLGGLGAFWVIFFTSAISGMGWIGGSYFRFLWLFSLTLGFCHLQKEEWFNAAFWLAFSASMRIFPLVFLGAAGLYLLLRWRRDRSYKPALQDFILGATFCFALLIGGSLLLYGLEAWQVFFQRILTHGNVFFVQHIGYKRIAVFEEWVLHQNFWWDEGLERMRVWNDRLNASWAAQRWFQYPLIGVLLWLCLTTYRRVRVTEYAALFGCMAIFLLTLPANYYYAMYALVAAVLLQSGRQWSDNLLLFAVFALWALVYAVPYALSGDALVHNYAICLGFFSFLLLWLGLRLLPRQWGQKNNTVS